MSVVFGFEEDPPLDELLLELPDEPLFRDELPLDELLELPDEPLFREELPDDLPLDELLLEEPLEELRVELPDERDELLPDFVFDSATLGHLGFSGSWVT
jgi:hypothetical protein